jgi:hypothetical protein
MSLRVIGQRHAASGDPIKLTETDFQRLSCVYFEESKRKFVMEDSKKS